MHDSGRNIRITVDVHAVLPFKPCASFINMVLERWLNRFSHRKWAYVNVVGLISVLYEELYSDKIVQSTPYFSQNPVVSCVDEWMVVACVATTTPCVSQRYWWKISSSPLLYKPTIFFFLKNVGNVSHWNLANHRALHKRWSLLHQQILTVASCCISRQDVEEVFQLHRNWPDKRRVPDRTFFNSRGVLSFTTFADRRIEWF